MALHIKYGDCLDESQIPAQCISDCSHSGDCYADVAYWQNELGFTVDRESAIKYLRQTGGWTQAKLEPMTDDELAYKVLWLACCDLSEDSDSENGSLFCMEG